MTKHPAAGRLVHQIQVDRPASSLEKQLEVRLTLKVTTYKASNDGQLGNPIRDPLVLERQIPPQEVLALLMRSGFDALNDHIANQVEDIVVEAYKAVMVDVLKQYTTDVAAEVILDD